MGHHAKTSLSLEEVSLPADHPWRKIPKIAMGVGIAGLVASLALIATTGDHAYYSYLTNYMYWLSFALGGLWFVIIHHLTRAGWSATTRRLAENLMVSLPIFALLWLPIAAGAGDLFMDPANHETLFHWVHPGDDPVLAKKTAFLNVPFFLVRALIYFSLWTLMARFYYKHSTAQDESGSDEHSHKARWWAPLALAFWALTVTFAAMDWIMSLDPHWFSTIFGLYYFAGCSVAVFATLALAGHLMQGQGLLTEAITEDHFHGLGKMLFGFVVFWSYIAFSQFMLIWYANIPEETLWFAHRWEGSWAYVTVLLGLGHFVLPFFFLMSRYTKRKKRTLMIGAAWLLIMHWVDMYWLIQPPLTTSHELHGATFGLVDITAFVGIGGILIGVFTRQLAARPMVAYRDPRIDESLAMDNGV